MILAAPAAAQSQNTRPNEDWCRYPWEISSGDYTCGSIADALGSSVWSPEDAMGSSSLLAREKAFGWMLGVGIINNSSSYKFPNIKTPQDALVRAYGLNYLRGASGARVKIFTQCTLDYFGWGIDQGQYRDRMNFAGVQPPSGNNSGNSHIYDCPTGERTSSTRR
ncbi:hypothetical protein PROH_14230 [Prochlorothrix hollandica PCC 9006 = CALU 1027]|uniref:Uncharacterized protein n=2 Tax=Prochlorothrix hollandica TaxID=1223 RepID=A0A0M2PS67_PROHO|nr:hypothetical protein PROH_14230 [Prochlorothrix hollandica PCC 9006 = CALU 1027]